MLKRFLPKKERSLGVARGKRRYDLGLNKDGGTSFLVILIGLMTFLAALALASSLALNAMTDRWSSGLENSVTIEIPSKDNQDNVRTPDDMQKLTERAHKMLSAHPAVETAHMLTPADVSALVEPWLGQDIALDKIPLPALIEVTIKEDGHESLNVIQDSLKRIDSTIRLDSHEKWLSDLIRFTHALQFASILITTVIGFTTIIAVAGAVKSRIAVHKDEVELLHLMGARDHYISRQFQLYIFRLSLQGSIVGLIIGMLTLSVIGWATGEMDIKLLPDLKLNHMHLATFLLLPLFSSILAAMTARHTVMKSLIQMS